MTAERSVPEALPILRADKLLNTSSVFFGDAKGLSLSSTSANHVADLAKEFVKSQSLELEGLTFINKEATALGSSLSVILAKGADKSKLDRVQQKLEEIGEAHALIAWLKEAIKYKNELLRKVESSSDIDDFYSWTDQTTPNKPEVREYLKARGIVEPEYIEPEVSQQGYDKFAEEHTTPEEQLALDRHKANEDLLSRVVIALTSLEDDLSRIKDNPQQKDDDFAVRYTPNVTLDDLKRVKDAFDKELKAESKKVENCQAATYSAYERYSVALNVDAWTKKREYEAKCKAYKAEEELFELEVLKKYYTQCKKDAAEFEQFKIKTCKEIGDLKITIPADLQSVYSKVVSMGK